LPWFDRSIRLTSGGERRVLIQPLIEARTSNDMTVPSTKGRLVSFLRITVCLMSFGFVFPYALMESTDAAKLAAKELLDAAQAADKSASGT
jgi:hypothetical protein